MLVIPYEPREAPPKENRMTILEEVKSWSERQEWWAWLMMSLSALLLIFVCCYLSRCFCLYRRYKEEHEWVEREKKIVEAIGRPPRAEDFIKPIRVEQPPPIITKTIVYEPKQPVFVQRSVQDESTDEETETEVLQIEYQKEPEGPVILVPYGDSSDMTARSQLTFDCDDPPHYAIADAERPLPLPAPPEEQLPTVSDPSSQTPVTRNGQSVRDPSAYTPAPRNMQPTRDPTAFGLLVIEEEGSDVFSELYEASAASKSQASFPSRKSPASFRSREPSGREWIEKQSNRDQPSHVPSQPSHVPSQRQEQPSILTDYPPEQKVVQKLVDKLKRAISSGSSVASSVRRAGKQVTPTESMSMHTEDSPSLATHPPEAPVKEAAPPPHYVEAPARAAAQPVYNANAPVKAAAQPVYHASAQARAAPPPVSYVEAPEEAAPPPVQFVEVAAEAAAPPRAHYVSVPLSSSQPYTATQNFQQRPQRFPAQRVRPPLSYSAASCVSSVGGQVFWSETPSASIASHRHGSSTMGARPRGAPARVAAVPPAHHASMMSVASSQPSISTRNMQLKKQRYVNQPPRRMVSQGSVSCVSSAGGQVFWSETPASSYHHGVTSTAARPQGVPVKAVAVPPQISARPPRAPPVRAPGGDRFDRASEFIRSGTRPSVFATFDDPDFAEVDSYSPFYC